MRRPVDDLDGVLLFARSEHVPLPLGEARTADVDDDLGVAVLYEVAIESEDASELCCGGGEFRDAVEGSVEIHDVPESSTSG